MQRAKESSANSFCASNKSFIYIKSILYIMEMKKEINWERVAEDRRAKVLWISRSQVFDALIINSQAATRVMRVSLPQSYRIRDVHFDFLRDAFGFVILSPEFPINVVGAELPAINEYQVVVMDLRKQQSENE